jgi:hypothetical protein
MIFFVVIVLSSCVSVLGTPHQNYKYYFDIKCRLKAEGHYGERWDITLTVECCCIESSYLYEDILISILFYETHQGQEELTKTVSFFFGNMKPDDSKTLSKTVKTKYAINLPTDVDNLRVDISDDATFTKKPIDDPAFLPWAFLVIFIVGGGAAIMGVYLYRSRKQAESIYTLGTSPKTPFASSHKAPVPSETNHVTTPPRTPTRVCAKCGAQLREAQKFCSHCGEINE